MGHKLTSSQHGFSGTYDGEGAECEATALAGKRSIRFRAVLQKLVAS
jgi:hypothetical protein